MAACGDRADSHLDSFSMIDLQAPAMFMHLAAGRDRPFVLELPPEPVNLRFDLKMTDVTETEILDELVRRDPSFQHARRGDALVFRPAGTAAASSPYSGRIAHFSMSGGIGDVIAALMQAAGSPVLIHAEKAVGRRPVSLDLEDAILRDALADVASQAHAGLIVEAGRINVSRVARPTSLVTAP